MKQEATSVLFSDNEIKKAGKSNCSIVVLKQLFKPINSKRSSCVLTTAPSPIKNKNQSIKSESNPISSRTSFPFFRINCIEASTSKDSK